MFGIVCSFKGFRAPYLKIRYHVDTMCKVDEFIYFDLRCSIRKHLEIIMVDGLIFDNRQGLRRGPFYIHKVLY